MSLELMADCTLCPRNCHADRAHGQKGYCRQTDGLVVARAALHMWEEPCISGESGSGTVFFSGCALGCVYCQNQPIASGQAGRTISIARLSEIFLELEAQGAANINLVTPSHFVPQIMQALDLARAKGLQLPIVYNCGGYEKVETLRLLEGYVDVYLPDVKYMSQRIAGDYSRCPDYFPYAAAAVEEMVRQTGEPVFDSSGMMRKGTIVRHLTLPGCLQDSKDILKYLHRAYGNRIYLSIMNQYTPLAHVEQYPELNRPISDCEYAELVDYAIALGIENAFVQEGGTATESFIPAFDGEGVEPKA